MEKMTVKDGHFRSDRLIIGLISKANGAFVFTRKRRKMYEPSVALNAFIEILRAALKPARKGAGERVFYM